MKLYPFQEDGVQFHVEHPYSLNRCEMGLGKSVQALEAARRSGADNVALFVPKFLESNWRNEIEKVFGAKPPFGFKTFPYSTLTRLKPEEIVRFDTWICDEAHYLKNYKAKRTDHFHTLLQKAAPERLYLLTGTPIKNRIPEFWTLFTFIAMGGNMGNFTAKYPSEWKFSNRFCLKEELYFGSLKTTNFYGVKKTAVPELRAIIASCSYGVKQKDAIGLPDMIRKDVVLGLPEDEKLREEFEAFMQGKPTPDSSNKAKSALLKAPKTVEYVKDIQDQGLGPVLIFSDHINSANLIAEGLRTDAITGQTPVKKRESLIRNFTSGKSDFLVATIGTGSVGYNLTASANCVFNDVSWVPADNLQAEKRVHRIGQTKKTVIHYLSSGPIDAYIQKTVRSKLEIISEVNV